MIKNKGGEGEEGEEGEEDVKTVTILQKGQITIPRTIQRKMGIKKGDRFVLVARGDNIMLKRSPAIIKSIEDDFSDILAISEHSLGKLWLNKEDDIWDTYLEEEKEKK
jgi:AbrB family looped-hinge helix DNA binding protein